MRLSTVSRLAAGLATLALATTALAMPASAATRFDADRDLLERFAATHSEGQYTAADLDAEEGVDDFEALADVACQDPSTPSIAPSADLVLLDLADSGYGPEVLVVSADVSTDEDPSTQEETCTFALLFTADGTRMHGSFSFVVGSDIPEGADEPLDETVTLSSAFNGDVFGIGPVFTNKQEYALASFTASGTQLTPAQRIAKVKVSTPKTAKQKKAAKKKYAKAVKSAKKAYAKAGKTKKAKKKMTKTISKAKKAYKKATATSKYVNRVKSYTDVKKFALDVTLDGADDVRVQS